MYETSLIEINLHAIARNMRLLQRVIGPECLICPIVKADAYGLGAVRISKTLTSAGAHMLAVFTPAQARELVASAVSGPLLILMPVREIDRTDSLYRALICSRLHLVVHDGEHLDHLVRMAERFGTTIPLHLEIDTGMSRGGCLLEDAPALARRIAAHPRLKLAGVFTHFAEAESNIEFTDEQLQQFNAFLEEHNEWIPSGCLIHAASTFATLRAERFHKSMVRIGIAWAGYGIESIQSGEVIAEGENLVPAVTWSSSIVQVKAVKRGTTVGYSATWVAPRDSILGVIPVGYADGYPIGCGTSHRPDDPARIAILPPGASDRSPHFAPIVGAVNMDQIVVDLTDVAAECDTIPVGTRVELISPDPAAPNHLPRIADMAGTFAHEMMTRLNPRLKRAYTMQSASSPADSAKAPTATTVATAI